MTEGGAPVFDGYDERKSAVDDEIVSIPRAGPAKPMKAAMSYAGSPRVSCRITGDPSVWNMSRQASIMRERTMIACAGSRARGVLIGAGLWLGFEARSEPEKSGTARGRRFGRAPSSIEN